MRHALLLCGLFLAMATACTPRADDPSAPDSAVSRALQFVEEAYNGRTFADPYLRFLYRGEPLAFPDPEVRLSYRLLDAYFILALLDRANVDRGAASRLFADASRVIGKLPRLWSGRALHSVRRHAEPDGLGMDTFAIVAYLRRDRGMALHLLGFGDREGWIPPGYYVGRETFRRFADDSWGVRALAVTGVGPGVLDDTLFHLLEGLRRSLGYEQDPEIRANLVLHGLETLEVVRAEGCDLSSRTQAKAEEATREFLLLAEEILRGGSLTSSTMSLANLGLALLPWLPPDAPLLERVEATVREAQRPDGSWRVTTAHASPVGTVFATLRCTLFLASRNASTKGRP